MNSTVSPFAPARLRWAWVLGAGLALALTAMFLWMGSGDGSHLFYAWIAAGILAGCGWLVTRSHPYAGAYGDLLMGGGMAGLFGSTFAAHAHPMPTFLSSPWLAWALLAVIAASLFLLADTRRSPWLGGAGLVLACLGVTLQQFTVFSLAANALLVAVTAALVQRRPWTVTAWMTLIAVHLGFLLGWPFSGGRIDPDRYLGLHEYGWTLAFFTGMWAVFTFVVLRSPESAFTPARRLAFATLNNALFLAVGVLIVPPRHPAWFWIFTLAAGGLVLLAGVFAGLFPRVRRAFLVQGATLLALGVVSASIGPQPAALLAVASAFFVVTCEESRQGVIRFCAGLAALMAFALAWEPVFRSDTPSLWLGAFTGAPLVFTSIWISRRRALWRRWAVLFFGALGLGLWLLTTLAQTPAQYHPPILALEAVIVTASFYLLGIAEFPWLATTVILLAQFLWFRQFDSFASRPGWNPCVLVVCTLGLSYWWQHRGRALVRWPILPWMQGLAAAASVAIVVLSVESRFGVTGTALIILSILAVAVPYYVTATDDWLLFALAQFLMVTAIGEFIGQLTHAPLPAGLAAFAPIVALLRMAPAVRRFFRETVWERPARGLALLYWSLAAVLFVVWTFHYVGSSNRFPLLAFVAVLLLMWCTERAGALLGASCLLAAGALIACWTSQLGAQGFRLRDFVGFGLLLVFGRILRGKSLLPDEVQRIGIFVGLATVTQWTWLWSSFYLPTLPPPVLWAVVAAVVVVVGWRLHEPFYLAFGWGLMAFALARVLWVDLITSQMPMGSDPAFRSGLLAIGLATLAAALVYTQRPRPQAR